MQLGSLDIAIVVAYIILIYIIALKANVFMRRRVATVKAQGISAIESHYLAARSISFWEAFLSIIATEFSAMAFIIIPTYVYYDNLNYFKFVIGACLSRILIAKYFVPKIYGNGLTIFEVLAKGWNRYRYINDAGKSGKRAFAIFYILTKVIGVSVKLLGGAILISEFFNVSVLFAIVLIAIMTYLYIILGGLKAVVRTDMIQATIFIIGGLLAHYVVAKMSDLTWGELINFGIKNGKLNLWQGSNGVLSFLSGIVAGIAYDTATHGVDQDLTQKFMGAKDKVTAQRALKWSAAGSLFVNSIFLSLGVILWSYYTHSGQALPVPDRLFSNLVENYFPSPFKGLIVASILAACMSTLDSSINAMSAVFWNDLISNEKSKVFRIYINIDNFIITIAIVMVAYLISLLPNGIRYGINLAYITTVPLLAFFICRLILFRYIKIPFTPSLIVFTIITCFFGMGINYFRFAFNTQLIILWGIITSVIFMWIFSKVSDSLKTKDLV